jgi:hypothetical protein
LAKKDICFTSFAATANKFICTRVYSSRVTFCDPKKVTLESVPIFYANDGGKMLYTNTRVNKIFTYMKLRVLVSDTNFANANSNRKCIRNCYDIYEYTVQLFTKHKESLS